MSSLHWACLLVLVPVLEFFAGSPAPAQFALPFLPAVVLALQPASNRTPDQPRWPGQQVRQGRTSETPAGDGEASTSLRRRRRCTRLSSRALTSPSHWCCRASSRRASAFTVISSIRPVSAGSTCTKRLRAAGRYAHLGRGSSFVGWRRSLPQSQCLVERGTE